MEDTYFVISVSEDGDVSVCPCMKQELLRQLTPDKDGYRELKAEDVLTKVSEKDPQYWGRQGGRHLIIKGKIVSPQAVERVLTFEIE